MVSQSSGMTRVALSISALVFLGVGCSSAAESAEQTPAGPSTQFTVNATTSAAGDSMVSALPTAPSMSGTFPTAPALELLLPNEAPPDPDTGARACEGSIRLTGSHFETAQWEVLPEAYPVIEDALNELRRYTDEWKVIIYGHTDARPFNGLPGGNEELSQRRAEAVASKLQDFGLDPARIDDVIGIGATELVSLEDTEEAHAENRRVEIVRYCANLD